MKTATLTTEIISEIKVLPLNLKSQVLNFIRFIKKDETNQGGIPGKSLLKYAGCINKRDLKKMDEAIKDVCEKVDLNEW